MECEIPIPVFLFGSLETVDANKRASWRGEVRLHQEAEEVEEVSYLLSKRELRLCSLHCIVLFIVQLKSNYDRRRGFYKNFREVAKFCKGKIAAKRRKKLSFFRVKNRRQAAKKNELF